MSGINDIKSTLPPSVKAPGNAAVDKQPAKKAESVTSPSSQGFDKISLTDAATQLQSLQQKISDVPVVNEQRVAELKAAIADGSYKIDAQELARKMINFEGDF